MVEERELGKKSALDGMVRERARTKGWYFQGALGHDDMQLKEQLNLLFGGRL
jgi:hypothetical protein